MHMQIEPPVELFNASQEHDAIFIVIIIVAQWGIAQNDFLKQTAL